MTDAAPTSSQVKKAGKTLRAWTRGELRDEQAAYAALDVLIAFRAAHRLPLVAATMGLRSRVKTAGCELEISQRLKRIPTILDKLKREPNLQLNTMQDIGGCRAVLGSIAEVRRVQKRFKGNRAPVRLYDYIAEPRASGYRGVHVIVHYDGRQIELQLRTHVMHEWAITVERLGGLLSQDLKGGNGPQPLLDLLQAASKAMALEEQDEEVDTDLLETIRRLREDAVAYLPGGA